MSESVKEMPRPARTLDDLYAEIPRVPCKVGCRDCCGVIPMSHPREADAFGHANVTTEILPKITRHIAMPNETGHCIKSLPNQSRHGCSIHATRPFVCRIFGTVAASEVPYNSPSIHLICPHGRKPDKPLTAFQAASMMREYLEIASAAALAERAKEKA